MAGGEGRDGGVEESDFLCAEIGRDLAGDQGEGSGSAIAAKANVEGVLDAVGKRDNVYYVDPRVDLAKGLLDGGRLTILCNHPLERLLLGV